MGRLAGFSYRVVTRKLGALGFTFERQAAGSHEVWVNVTTQKITIVPHHASDLREGTLRSILRQAGVTVDQFLAA